MKAVLALLTSNALCVLRRILSVRPSKDIKAINNDEPVNDDLVRFVAKQSAQGIGRKRSPNGVAVWEAETENTYHDENVIAATSGANGEIKTFATS